MIRKQRENAGLVSVLLWGAVLLSGAAVFGDTQYDPNQFSPDNAAYWYTKAFALYEEDEDIKGGTLSDYMLGYTELTPELEQYLKERQNIIPLIETATTRQYCDWHYDPLEDPNYWNPIPHEASNLSDFLLADGYYHANKGDIPIMLKRIDLALEMSRQVNTGEYISNLRCIGIRQCVYSFIQHYLNQNPDIPIENLRLIDNLLQKEISRKYSGFNEALDYQILQAKFLLNNPIRLNQYSTIYAQILNGEKNEIEDSFYQRNFKCYEDYIRRFREASEVPYPLARVQMTSIIDEYTEKWKKYTERFNGTPEDYKATQEDCDYTQQYDFIYIVTIDICGGSSLLESLYTMEIRLKTQLNALRTGITLLTQFKTQSSLPDALGSGYPIDLFGNLPFLIIKKEDHFILRCQGKEKAFYWGKDKINEYEFNLKVRPEQDNQGDNDNDYEPDNAAYWYQEGVNLIPYYASEPWMKELQNRLLSKEAGWNISSDMTSILLGLFDEEGLPEVQISTYLYRNIKSSPAVREYVDQQRDVIDFYLKGASMKQCQWIDGLADMEESGIDIIAMVTKANTHNMKMIEAIQLMIADALINAEDGKIDEATNRILAVFDVMKHYDQRAKTRLNWDYDCMFDLVSIGVLRVLPYLENSSKNLFKLKRKLTEYTIGMKSANDIFDYETDRIVKEVISRPGGRYGSAAGKLIAQKLIEDLGYDGTLEDDEISIVNFDIDISQKIYLDNRRALKETLEKPLSDTYDVIVSVKKDCSSDIIEVQGGLLIVDLNYVTPLSLINRWERDYYAYLKTKANIHACQAAVNVMMKVRNGRYPERLTASAPEDPFTCERFDCIKTDRGFRLTSRTADPISDEVHQWIIEKP